MVKENKGRELAEKFISSSRKAQNMAIVRKTMNEEKLYDKVGKGEVKAYQKYQKKQQVGRNTIADIKYRRSFGGRLQRGIQAIRSPTQSIYRRNMTVAQIKAFDKMNKARRQPQGRKQLVYTRPMQTPQQREFDFCFNGGGQMANIVENEINRSHARCGDREARSMGVNSYPFASVNREALFFANQQHIAPSINVSREVNRHSRKQHRNAVQSITNEVNFYSHLLD